MSTPHYEYDKAFSFSVHDSMASAAGYGQGIKFSAYHTTDVKLGISGSWVETRTRAGVTAA